MAPHVYPGNVGTIPMSIYETYERLPVQRTAELSFMTPPPSRDSNPHDLDTAAEAGVRSKIINTHVHYRYSEAEAILNNVYAHDTHLQATKLSVAAAAAGCVAATFGGRAWGDSGGQVNAGYRNQRGCHSSLQRPALVPRGTCW